MLLAVMALKLIAETALMVLLALWLLGLLAGGQRNDNLVYHLLRTAARPFVALARWVSPPVVLERHLPLVAVLLLVVAWLVLTVAKVGICLRIGVALCR